MLVHSSSVDLTPCGARPQLWLAGVIQEHLLLVQAAQSLQGGDAEGMSELAIASVFAKTLVK